MTASSDSIRVTIAPGEDVLMPPNTRLGLLRPGLARLLGRTDLLVRPLFVGPMTADDDALTGHFPILAGAILACTPQPDDGVVHLAQAALAAPWALRVIDGPDAGWVLALSRSDVIRIVAEGSANEGHAIVGRGQPRVTLRRVAAPAEGNLARASRFGLRRRQHYCVRTLRLADPEIGAQRLEVQMGARGPRVRSTSRGRRRSRTRRLRSGALFSAGLSTFEVLDADAISDTLVDSTSRAATGSGATTPHGSDSPRGRSSRPAIEEPRRRRPRLARLLALLVPASGAIAMAVMLHQPLFALMALAAPLSMLASTSGRAGNSLTPNSHRASNSMRRTAPGSEGRADLMDLIMSIARGRDHEPRFTPAATRTGLTFGAASPPTAVPSRRSPPTAVTMSGPPGRAHTRALICTLAASGYSIQIVAEPAEQPNWAWCRWLDAASASFPHDGDVFTSGFPSAPGRGPGTGLAPASRPEHSPSRAPRLVVSVNSRDSGTLTAASQWWARAEPGTRLIMIEDGPGPMPAWLTPLPPAAGMSVCVAQDVARALASVGGHLATNHGQEVHDSGIWGERPGLRSPAEQSGPSRGEASTSALASSVSLCALLEVPPPVSPDASQEGGAPNAVADWIAERWRQPPPGLLAVLGKDARGTHTVVDLPTDGPHALVAGTTGAGKSEFLQTLIASLALAYSPRDLVFALVDYKGGTSFGACARFPHVLGLVTDLEQGLARRALAGLGAELRRRERLLADRGAANIDAYQRATPHSPDTEPLPRLVIIVDEFRAMADDLPAFLPGLMRIAAQGRSLGIHLILATQRPAGAVTPDMRANIGLRIALRVTDEADSRDVIDSPAAAHLPASAPGRAMMRTTTRPLITFQSAYAPAPIPLSHPGAQVVRAPLWLATTRPRSTGRGHGGVARGSLDLVGGGRRIAAGTAAVDGTHGADNAHGGAGSAQDVASHTHDIVEGLVAAAHAASSTLAIGSPRPVWLPGLPAVVQWEDLATEPESGRAGEHCGRAGEQRAGADEQVASTADDTHLAFGLADSPSTQSRDIARWDVAAGHLGIEGPTGSGRTTALLSLASSALARGWHVHLVAGAAACSQLQDWEVPDGGDGLGTVVGPDDPRRIAALLRALSETPAWEATGESLSCADDARALKRTPRARVRRVLLIDDVEEVWAALGLMARGSGPDALVAALRLPRAARVHVAVASTRALPSALAALLRHRLVFASATALDDVARGVPRELAGLGGPAGRAIWSSDAGPLACQIALPQHPTPCLGAPAVASVGAEPTPIRIRPVPERVRRADLTAPPPHQRTRVGPGHERTARHETLIPVGVGGHEATTVFLNIARGALIAGPHGSGRSHALATIWASLDPARTLIIARDGPLLDLPARLRITDFASAPVREVLAVLDDLAPPAGPTSHIPWTVLLDDAEAFAQGCPLDTDRLTRAHLPGRLIAAATTQGAAGALRGPLAELRAIRTGIVLDPAVPASADVFGAPLTWHIEPGTCPAGRGVLVHGRDVRLVQLSLGL